MSWYCHNPATVAANAAGAFAEQDLAYCYALSQALLNDPACRDYPDLIALGFWLRKGNLLPMLAPYRQGTAHYRPLGQVFHNAPANVDSLFVYSGILSLLAGNDNVIRLSRRRLGSSALLLAKINELAATYPQQNARFQLISCEHDDPQLAKFLKDVDGRVLWGSDQTITTQRQQQTVAAHCRDIIFNHKFSLSVFSAAALNHADEETFNEAVALFHRDALTFAQQACSSPKAVIWLGSNAQVAQAQQRFWPALASYTARQGSLTASDCYSALTQAQQLVMQDACISGLTMSDPLIRLQAGELSAQQVTEHHGQGVFIELTLPDLQALTPLCTNAHQSLTYWGLSHAELGAWVVASLPDLDRIIPVGEALNFTEQWDGMALLAQFTRKTFLR